MKLLTFSERDLPLTKGLRSFAEIVTAWPVGKGQADIIYDPNVADLSDVLSRLPSGFKPDAVLLTNLDYVTFLWGFHALEVPVVATIADSTLCLDAFRSALPFVDFFVCNEERQCESLKSLGAEAAYLPWFGIDPDVCSKSVELPKWDVAFAGNLNPAIHQKRGRLLEALLSVAERFDTRIFTGLSPRDCVRAFSRARIVFHCTIRSGISRAVYQALGVGRLLMVEESNDEVLRHFEDRKHLVTYSDSNLIEQIEHYLRSDREREAIAQAGHEEVLSKHTSVHKARQLLELLKARLDGSGRGIKSASADVLHRSAARVLLHHGRVAQTRHHLELALSNKDTPENRVAGARMLGAVAYFHGQQNPSVIDAFQAATTNALEVAPRGAWTRLNHLELGHWLGRLDAEAVRELIAKFLHGHLEMEPEGGPLPIGFDRFRVAWEEFQGRTFECAEARSDAQRKLFVARAYEILGEVEHRAGRGSLALEAFRAALAYRSDGYIKHRLGTVLSELDQPDPAREALRSAVSEEPFFFGARRDLAALELNRADRLAARSMASESLRKLVPPFRSFYAPLIQILDLTAAPEHLEPYTLGKPILWEGAFFNTTGNGRDSSLLVDDLLQRGLPITVRSCDLPGQPSAMEPRVKARLVEALRRPLDWDFVHIAQLVPGIAPKRPEARASICRATYELEGLPRAWHGFLTELDELWVTSEFTRRNFLEAGIPAHRLTVIPSPLAEFPLPESEELTIETKKCFRFLSVFEWNRRKGWDILLRAFLEEFRRGDDVVLLLRVYSLDGKSQVEIRDEMRAFIRRELKLDPDVTPEILFVDETLSHGEMRSLYAQADAFVLPSRGEGFGRTYLESLIAGLPTIGTAWGGHLDFLSHENGYLIEISGLEPVPEEIAPYRGSRWARPSADHLRAILRHVYEDPEEGRMKARRSVGELLQRFNVRRVSNLILSSLNRLEE